MRKEYAILLKSTHTHTHANRHKGFPNYHWCTTYNILKKFSGYHEFSENFIYMKNNQLAYFHIAAWEN